MPTEKDVQYYEELVREQVADKQPYFGCKVRITRHLIPGYVVAGNKTQDNLYVDVVAKNKVGKTFVEQFSLNDYIEILGHEIRPHHLLLRCEKNNVFCRFTQSSTVSRGDATSLYIVTQYSEYNIIRDLSKHFSGQSDATKIELGKIVESVLSFKKK